MEEVVSLSLATPAWEDVPQKRPTLRNDFGVRISIAPFRRSMPHLHVTLSAPQLEELGWAANKTVLLLQILRDNAGAPIKARVRRTDYGDSHARWLWRSSGPGLAGCGRVSFRLPEDMAAARATKHEPDFRADLHTDQARNSLTINLPPIPQVPA